MKGAAKGTVRKGSQRTYRQYMNRKGKVKMVMFECSSRTGITQTNTWCHACRWVQQAPGQDQVDASTGIPRILHKAVACMYLEEKLRQRFAVNHSPAVFIVFICLFEGAPVTGAAIVLVK